MKLAFPWALVLLIPLVLELFRQRKTKQSTALLFPSLNAFAQMPQTLRQRLFFLPNLLGYLALLLLIFAAAKPQIIKETKGIPKEGIAIELVVDISSSMDMSMPFKTNYLSRMEISKKVVSEFVKQRPNDLIGLITFARFADTICPLTLSHDSLQFFIQDLAIEIRPNEDGTAFGDAVALAAARLKTTEERYKKKRDYTIKSKVIILLTDGDNNCGLHLPMEAAALTKKWGIRLHAIAITDLPEKKTIQTPNGPVEVEEEPLISARILARMAETTGGIFRRASNETALSDIYSEINKMETTKIETERYHTYTDIFPPFAATALLLLFLRALLLSTWLRRIP